MKHIVVATDGSEISERAAAVGGDLARALDATVTLLYVHDEQAVIPEVWQAVGIQFQHGAETMSTEDIRSRMEDHALANDLARSAQALGEVTTKPQLVNVWGHAADQICDYADEHDADMIVIGSHGRSGIRKAILGSVSHAVANRAPCAVTIVR